MLGKGKLSARVALLATFLFVMLLMLVSIPTSVSAQITGNGTINTVPKFTGSSTIGNSVITDLNGSVGIGLPNPVLPLQVNGPLRVENGSNSVGSRDSATDTSITIYTRSYGSVIQATNYQENSTKNLFINPWGGNVGVGTTNPQYSLSVNGTIQAKEVIVNTGWSDYVFEPDYRVRPLTEVAAFIKANHHLPDIPSGAEIKQNGVSLGDMQAKLLAKIEELTLQVIQLDEKNRALEKKVAQLEGR